MTGQQFRKNLYITCFTSFADIGYVPISINRRTLGMSGKIPERGAYSDANADGARHEPFQFVYENSEIPAYMQGRLMLRLKRLRKAKK